jgi:ketosteroid isomerase-like protein
MNALQDAEHGGDIEPLVVLFHENAELSNLVLVEPLTGHQQIRRFWRDYLNEFRQITSRFVSVIENDNASVLEWISEGFLKTGEPLTYQGVTILKIESGKIINFRSYYDSAVFVSKETRSANQRHR